MSNNPKTFQDLRQAIGDALKINALCMGSITGEEEPCLLPQSEGVGLSKEILDARWKIHDIIDVMEQESKE